ncbi:MAG: hypothetical protein KDK39_15980 [Leptospiraceae bacterium]|nr:hypothetical protein [Leptospiraceae bacterium]
MSYEWLQLPFFSALAMFGFAVFLFLKVRGQIGLNVTLVSLFSGLWALSLFLEYFLEHNALIENRVAPLFWIKGSSVVAGASAFLILTFFVKFILDFPPCYTDVRRLDRWVIVGGLVLAAMAVFGIRMELVDGRIQRIPGPVMMIQFGGLVTYLLIAATLLVQKSRNYLSRLRKNQLQLFTVGIGLALLAGGPITLFFPLQSKIVMIAASSPLIFIITVTIGLFFGRRLFQDHPEWRLLHAPGSEAEKDQQRNQLLQMGIEYTIYIRRPETASFVERDGRDRLEPPTELLQHARDHRVFFYEDFDDQPTTAAYQFLQRNYIQAGLCYFEGGVKNANEYLVLIHDAGKERILSARDVLCLEEHLV